MIVGLITLKFVNAHNFKSHSFDSRTIDNQDSRTNDSLTSDNLTLIASPVFLLVIL